jgi:hypothetical protein
MIGFSATAPELVNITLKIIIVRVFDATNYLWNAVIKVSLLTSEDTVPASTDTS